VPKSKRQPPASKNKRNLIKSKEDRYVEKHHQGSVPVTKKEFMAVLKKAATPISEWQHDSGDSKTSAVHPSDGCSDKYKNQDRIGDTED
jgi:hypothetical protein